MRTLSRDRFDSGLATLRRFEAEHSGVLLAEVDVPAERIGGDALRVASLSVRGPLAIGTVNQLVSLARDIRGRLVMDRDGYDHTITVTIARALDYREEPALAARMQERARLGGEA